MACSKIRPTWINNWRWGHRVRGVQATCLSPTDRQLFPRVSFSSLEKFVNEVNAYDMVCIYVAWVGYNSAACFYGLVLEIEVHSGWLHSVRLQREYQLGSPGAFMRFEIKLYHDIVPYLKQLRITNCVSFSVCYVVGR